MSSGQAELANRIAAVSNYAYVPEIESPDLDDWAAQAGLSREELTLIQPSYYETQLFTASFFLMAISVWAVGLLVALMNGFFVIRRKRVMGIPMLGLFVAAVLTFFGISCFNAAARAYDFAQQLNSPFYQAASRDLGPFALSAVVSIGIALAIPVLSLNGYAIT